MKKHVFIALTLCVGLIPAVSVIWMPFVGKKEGLVLDVDLEELLDPVPERVFASIRSYDKSKYIKRFFDNGRTLNLSFLELSSLDGIETIEGIELVENLELGWNVIKTLEALKSFPNIKYLSLNGNSMKVLPKGIDKLVHLEKLDISENELLDISDLAPLINSGTLKSLDLNANKFHEDVRAVVEHMFKKELPLSVRESIRNSMSHRFYILEWRKERSTWHKLNNWYEYNHGANIDVMLQVKDGPKYRYLGGHKILNLTGLGLTTLKGIGKIPDIEWVESIDLSNNHLTSVKELLPYTNIKRLWLSRNQLTELPEGLSEMVSLKKLCLDTNKIENISGLENLVNLEEKLCLRKNNISDVSVIAQLNKLKILDIGDNIITKEQLAWLQKELGVVLVAHKSNKGLKPRRVWPRVPDGMFC